jgi:hypothetical protein
VLRAAGNRVWFALKACSNLLELERDPPPPTTTTTATPHMYQKAEGIAYCVGKGIWDMGLLKITYKKHREIVLCRSGPWCLTLA